MVVTPVGPINQQDASFPIVAGLAFASKKRVNGSMPMSRAERISKI